MYRSFARTLVLSCVAGALSTSARAQATTLRVSVSSSAAQGSGYSAAPAISSNGRFCAFESSSDLVASDTNGSTDVYLRDSVTGLVVRASVGAAGAQANQICLRPSVSSDGRYVAFDSLANNLATPDNNHVIDVFVRDTQTGTTTRVSVDSNGAEGNSSSPAPAISADGRYVAFSSGATNLVAGDTNLIDDVFVHDMQSGATTRVSVSSNGDEGDDLSETPVISGDGRFVAFHSYASTLVAGDTNARADIFVHDRTNATTTRASVDSNGVQGNQQCGYSCALSADGRFVAFTSQSTNLVVGDTNGVGDMFLRDIQGATTTRINVSSSGAQANMRALWPAISSDGRFVVFVSPATNLVPGDANAKDDVFVRDVLAGTTELVSVDSNNAQANEDSGFPMVSMDGRYVAFASAASNLVAGDTNGAVDIFVRDRGIVCSSLVYCTAGTTTSGCVPSIQDNGVPSSSAASGFTISVTAVEGQRIGLILYGLASQATPWGNGGTSYLCVAAPRQRTGSTSTGGTLMQCDGLLSVDWNAWRAANPNALGSPFSPGETCFAQGWFRDSGAPKGTNLSNALRFTLCN